jgi:AcrR family transcriptional regulator
LTLTWCGDNVVDMTATRTRLPYAEAAKVLLRDTLLAAATDQIRARGWAQTTMADIAAAAGVSRQTLYKEFGSRQAVAQAHLAREADRFLTAVEDAVLAHVEHPREALAAALQVFLTGAAEEPLIRAIVSGEDEDGLLASVTDHTGPLLTGAADRLAAFLLTCWPQVPTRDGTLLARTLVRLAVSHAASPSADPAATAADVTAVLGPYVDQLTGTA